MKHQERPCGFCSSRHASLRTESFTDGTSAFRRHAELVSAGLSPSFCRRRDGRSYVCHLAASGNRAD